MSLRTWPFPDEIFYYFTPALLNFYSWSKSPFLIASDHTVFTHFRSHLIFHSSIKYFFYIRLLSVLCLTNFFRIILISKRIIPIKVFICILLVREMLTFHIFVILSSTTYIYDLQIGVRVMIFVVFNLMCFYLLL